MGKISKDTPLAEITLRKYEKPHEKITKRDLIRKICLSCGLLQPGDSRDIIVDILFVLANSNKPMTAIEVEEKVIANRKKNNLELKGIASSNIRRQLRRLRGLFIIEKVNNNYRITENAKLSDTFDEKIIRFYLNSIVERVREYFSALDK